MTQKPIKDEVQDVVEDVKQEVTTARRPWYYLSKAARILLMVYAVQLTLFAALAWWVHTYPVLAVDVAITREFQENPSPWLNITMLVISYPGSSFLLPALVILAALIFWLVGLRLEAIVILALSLVSS